MKRLHSPAGLVAVAVSLTWGVAVLLALVDVTLARNAAAWLLLTKAGAHARLLLGIPMLICAERLLALRIAAATRSLRAEAIVQPVSIEQWHRATRHIEAWRASRFPALVIAAAVIALTALGLAGALPNGFLRWAAPMLHESVRAASAGSLAVWWFICVGQPILLFLFLRFLWSWFLWGCALWSLSRATLRLQATHPDRVAGVGFLTDVLDGFMLFTLCVAIILSATWMDEIRATGVAAATFAPTFLVHITFALVVGVAPYMLLSPSLFRAKRAGLNRFAGLGRTYVDAFDERWLSGRERSRLLGTPDVQSLAAFSDAFRVIEETRLNIVPARTIAWLVLLAIAPLVPLVVLEMPAKEIARRVLELLL